MAGGYFGLAAAGKEHGDAFLGIRQCHHHTQGATASPSAAEKSMNEQPCPARARPTGQGHRHVTRAIHPDRNGATEPLPRRVPVDGLRETLQDIFVPSYTHLVPFPVLTCEEQQRREKNQRLHVPFPSPSPSAAVPVSSETTNACCDAATAQSCSLAPGGGGGT